MRKGVFWITERDPVRMIAVSIPCDADGKSLDGNTCYSSKSGENFNHRIEWERLDHSLTSGKTFQYYPRGRVEVRRGKITIYLNPDINTWTCLAEIFKRFELVGLEETVSVKNDGSAHYRYYG